MTILSDMYAALIRRITHDARRRTLPGFEPGRLVFLIGQPHAYQAARSAGDWFARQCTADSAFGVPIIWGGCIGFDIERRAR